MGKNFSTKHTPRPIVFIIPDNNLPLDKTLRNIFNQAGFCMLKCINSVCASMIGVSDVFRAKKLSTIFAIDVMPLPAIGKIENPRIFNVHKLLRKNKSRNYTIAVCNENTATKLALTLLSNAQQQDMYSLCAELAAEYATDHEVVSLLQNGSYSKVEIIRGNDELQVRKTFRRWQSVCVEREISARKELAGIPEISPIIDHGRFHITIPYYHAEYIWDKNSLAPYPIHCANIVFALLKKIWQRGWAMIDCHPGNFIFTHDGVKIIDLEYAYEHRKKDINFTESWDMIGPPKTVLEDMPMSQIHAYSNIWYPAIGLNYETLIDPKVAKIWRQYLHRILFCSRKLVSRNIRRHVIAARKKNVPITGDWIYLPMQKKYY